MQFGIGIALAAVLVFIAVFFGWRQRQTLAQLRFDHQIASEDRRYYVKQVRRRMVCSFLLVVLAGLLVGWFGIDRDIAPPAEGEALTEEAKDALRFITWYWIVILAFVLVVLFLAAFDFLATARFGLRRMRQLEHDRRAVLEMEAAKLRRRRTELN